MSSPWNGKSVSMVVPCLKRNRSAKNFLALFGQGKQLLEGREDGKAYGKGSARGLLLMKLHLGSLQSPGSLLGKKAEKEESG